MSAAVWVCAAFACLAAALTLFNLVVWPRGRRGRFAGDVSVLIPARDEASTIEACVRAAAASSQPLREIIVLDDGSTDGTGEILARVSEDVPALRVIAGRGLPPGWVGKPHACHQLAQAAAGDWLVFVDADTRLRPEGLERLASVAGSQRADVITAVPRQRTGSWFESLVLPLLHLTYTAWLPLPLIWRSRDPRFLAANGQVLAVRRDACDRIGGFEAVRSDVVDDMAFCRAAKRAGLRVGFADGFHVADCRMYGSAVEVWRGFSKNLYPGIGGTLPALLGVVSLYVGAFIVPYVALFAAAFGAGAVAPAAVGVGANVLARAALAIRFRHPLASVLAHPIGIACLIAIAINSMRWTLRGAIAWRGRVYARSGS